MYRFSAGRGGRPHIDWKVTYRNSGIHKPSQVDAGIGHHADGHERRLRGDHRQRGSDERGRVPHAPRACGTASTGWSARCRCSRKGGSATENSLITAGPLADRGEQLRLPGPVRPQRGRDHRAGLRPRGHQQGRQRLPPGLDEHDRARAHRGPEALDEDRADLHLHPGSRPGGRSALVLDGARLPHGTPAWKQLAGTGSLFNNNYAGIAIGPSGTSTWACSDGIVALRDTR